MFNLPGGSSVHIVMCLVIVILCAGPDVKERRIVRAFHKVCSICCLFVIPSFMAVESILSSNQLGPSDIRKCLQLHHVSGAGLIM